jgi:hypothetical protein
MRFRTLALAFAIGLALTAGAEARKNPHSKPPTIKSMNKAHKLKAPKGRKIKKQKVAKQRKVRRKA